jgi:hypothetical protein
MIYKFNKMERGMEGENFLTRRRGGAEKWETIDGWDVGAGHYSATTCVECN